MAKKKKEQEIKMSKEHISNIEALSFKIEDALNSLNIKDEDELETFAEAIALTILRFGRESEWPAFQTISYAGYVITTFLEKGICAEIDKLEQYITKQNLKKNNKIGN